MNASSHTYEEVLATGQRALQRGDNQTARRCFETILARLPGDLSAEIGIGLVQVLEGNLDDGIALLHDLYRLHPGQQRVLDSLGIACASAGRFDEAEKSFRKALRIGGFQLASALNLGTVLNELGRFDEAAILFRRCLRKDPANVSARYHLGLNQLLAGEYAAGWEGFELRNKVAGRTDPAVPGSIPRWTGVESLQGKTVVMLAEQGLGDTIQFARYATAVEAAGGKAIIQCATVLHELISNIAGVDAVAAPDGPPATGDYQVPLLSLAGLFGTVPETIPCPGPYMHADQGRRTHWNGTLTAPEGHRRIGVVWAGNPDNKTDRKRSVALGELAPMLSVSGCTFFSLQVGKAVSDLAAMDADLRPAEVFDTPLPFDEVAAIVSALDLVITVDTSIAHLAGALGVPVWTLISYVPDWRWGLGRADTGWYASMRLYRQSQIGDWSDPIRRIAEDLSAMAAHR